MARALRGPVWATLIVVSFGIPARAQTSQIWPEISTFVKLNDRMRFYFLATKVKESVETTEGEYGPNFDFYLKPLRRKTILGTLPLDESKNRLLMVRVGYHYIHSYSGNGSDEHRGVLEATARYPLMGGVLVSDRNRLDIRSIGGENSWRYRNRLTVEKEFSIGRFRFGPYGRAEAFYDSRYDKWSRTALVIGSTFPITKHFELEGYLEHWNDSGGSANWWQNAVGVVINLYF